MTVFRSTSSYQHFEAEVVGQRRYIWSAETEEFLSAIRDSCVDRIEVLPKGTELARAQEGPQPSDALTHWPEPWPKERMKPLYNRAREGRANPTGIPFLYMATDWKTAILEIRPALGLYVTVAHCVTRRPLNIVNCAKGPFYGGGLVIWDPQAPQPEPSVRADYVWNGIDNAFAAPWVRDEFHPGYAPTQIVAELFRNQGYDGIRYQSMFGHQAHNIALFSPEDADIVSTKLVVIKEMDCKWTTVDLGPSLAELVEGLDGPVIE